jgi:hypothetical protein
MRRERTLISRGNFIDLKYKIEEKGFCDLFSKLRLSGDDPPFTGILIL